MALLYHIFHYNFWTIMSYYIICQKSAIISIISLLLYHIFLFDSIVSIIAIKPIIFMIINHFNYCLLFHSNWNNRYNSHNSYNKAAMSHLMLQCAFTPHSLSLHIADLAQSPRMDQPHPASVPWTLQAVAWRSR